MSPTQLVAHRDAHRLLSQLERGKTVILGGVENLADLICPSRGEVTPQFTAAPAPQVRAFELVAGQQRIISERETA